MKKVLIINTGGTFNKRYNPISGALEIDEESHALEDIFAKWLCHCEIIHIIGKDSLDMTPQDRKILYSVIEDSSYDKIIIIHGTDTIDISAKYLDDSKLKKCIVFSGAMVPYSIDPVEATANLASAYGYIQAQKENGVYIAMNGTLDRYNKVKKDRKKGRFTL